MSQSNSSSNNQTVFGKQTKHVIAQMAEQLRTGQEINILEFFGAPAMYAMSASKEDLGRLLRINIAEVMKDEIRKQSRKYDA